MVRNEFADKKHLGKSAPSGVASMLLPCGFDVKRIGPGFEGGQKMSE